MSCIQLLGPLLADLGKSEEFGKYASFFSFPPPQTLKLNPSSLCSHGRGTDYIVIDIVYSKVKRLWGWWGGDGTPNGLLHAKKAMLPGPHLQPGDRPVPAGAYFVFPEFLPRGASSSLMDRGSSSLRARPWENPLKIAEN